MLARKVGQWFIVPFHLDKWTLNLCGFPKFSPVGFFHLRQNINFSTFLPYVPQPQPVVDLWGCGSTYNPTPLCRDLHSGITLLWSCCSLTHDHTDPWMGISAGFSKPNICASQHCHCSNHSLNQNTKSNFTWMPQHKYLIMAENKSLSFCTLSSSCGLLL